MSGDPAFFVEEVKEMIIFCFSEFPEFLPVKI
jgi:hypothetical protein